jgi:hypothetical protein
MMSDLLVFASLAIAFIAFMSFWFLFKSKSSDDQGAEKSSNGNLDRRNPNSLEVMMPDLPLIFTNLATLPDTANLKEVKDIELVSRLNAVIPNAMDVVGQLANQIPKNAVLIDIPFKDLVKSKAIDGAKRAFAVGKDGIAKNANLVKLDPSKSAQLANVAANVMNVAALVVGQQMMSEINAKLSELNKGIERLQEIAVAELKSKIIANIAMVMEISNAQVEILENSELRQNKLNSIDGYKKSVVELIGQVNFMIESIIAKPDFRLGSKGFKDYEKVVQELDDLKSWQNTLMSLLEQISRLSHAFSLGVISLEKSSAVFQQFLEVSENVNRRLGAWHDMQIKSLQIDVSEGRAGKGAIERLPGLIKRDLRFLRVKKEFSASIERQQSSRFAMTVSNEDSFNSDVQLLLVDGKYFYRPNGVHI